MGSPKALVQLGGQALVRRASDRLKAVFQELLIVTRPQMEMPDLGIPVAYDLLPGNGPLGGIYTALKASQRPVFCFACDMPFLDSRLIQAMVDDFNNLDVLLPEIDRKLHPLHAIYSPNCTGYIKAALGKGERRITGFLPQVRAAYFTEDRYGDADAIRLALFNVNTQADLLWAEKIAKYL